MAALLDGPAVSCKPSAAKVLAALLNELRSAAARERRGSLALVRELTKDKSGQGA